MKKVFLIGCGVVVLAVVGMVVLVLINNGNTSKELICKSNNGNITLTYDNETIIGYNANGYEYNLLSERSRAEQLGIDKYIEDFSKNFNTETSGSCTK